MHSVAFLQDLAVVMIVAGLVTLIFHRFKQPVVLGYIIAGVIIGPHTPPFVLIHDKETIDTLAELGVILLMFSLGLEFNLRKLTQVGASALIAAVMEILLLFWVGYEIGRFFGVAPCWTASSSARCSRCPPPRSSSRCSAELGKMKEHFAQLIFGILILEDILGIAMIALLSGIAMTGPPERGRRGPDAGQARDFPGGDAGGGFDRRAAAARLRGAVQKQRDVDRDGAGLVLRRVAAGRQAGLQRGARRVHHRRGHRRGAGDSPGGSPAGTGARYVQRHLLCGHRVVDQPGHVD